jgi:hypothetical protein
LSGIFVESTNPRACLRRRGRADGGIVVLAKYLSQGMYPSQTIKGSSGGVMKYSDVVCGIFAYFDNYEFTTERVRIHNAFYKQAINEKYKALFSDITFSSATEYHKSEELDQCIDNLILSRLLTAQNPDLIKYTVSPGLVNYYKSNGASLLEGKNDLVKKVSQDIYKLVRI